MLRESKPNASAWARRGGAEHLPQGVRAKRGGDRKVVKGR